jgi:hypothetical protein
MQCKKLNSSPVEVNKGQGCKREFSNRENGEDCHKIVNNMRNVKDQDTPNIIRAREVSKSKAEGFKGCNPCKWGKVPHDNLTECRSDACPSQEVCTSVTPAELEQTNGCDHGWQRDCTEFLTGQSEVNHNPVEVKGVLPSQTKLETSKPGSEIVPEVQGRVLHSNHKEVEIEIPGRIRTSGTGKSDPEIMWLVDTGTTKSIISIKTYHQYLDERLVDKTCTRMTAINGSNVPVLGKTILTIAINGKEYKHTFLIAGIEEEGILGKDFLRENRCYWNWEQNTLEIDGDEIKCRIPLLKDIPALNVKAVRSYTIPAKTEMIIEGVLVSAEKTLTTGMVTGIAKFMTNRQLGVAATLTKRHGRIVPVRVMNSSTRKRFVGINDMVASYQAVEILEQTSKGECRATQVTDEQEWTVELEDLYNRCQEGLNPVEKDICTADGRPRGRINPVQDKFYTGSHGPINQQPRRTPLGHTMSESGQESIRAVRTSMRQQRGRTCRTRRNNVRRQPDQNWGMEEIRKWQEEDPDLRVVGAWTERPAWVEIARERTAVKYYWSRWKQMQKRDGIWYYQWKEATGSDKWKIIIPPVGQPEILKEYHDKRISGHFGMEKTISRLRQSSYFWPRLRMTVGKWCRECRLCTRKKPANLKAETRGRKVDTS